MAETNFRLSLYESINIVPLKTYAAGTYQFRGAMAGNSLLCTLWVKDLAPGVTVNVRYWDFGPGGGENPGERVDVGAHLPITTPDTSDRRLISRVHNKVNAEVEIIGGSAELGLYGTVVSDFLSEGSFYEGQVANLADDGAAALAVYDPATGKFNLLRGEQGVAFVKGVGGTIYSDPPGLPKIIQSDENLETTTGGAEFDLLTVTVPASKVWKIRKTRVVCGQPIAFKLLVDSVRQNSGRTGPSEGNVNIHESPYIAVAAGAIIKIKAVQIAGPKVSVAAYLSITEENI